MHLLLIVFPNIFELITILASAYAMFSTFVFVFLPLERPKANHVDNNFRNSDGEIEMPTFY
jgi:hypothetical protein